MDNELRVKSKLDLSLSLSLTLALALTLAFAAVSAADQRALVAQKEQKKPQKDLQKIAIVRDVVSESGEATQVPVAFFSVEAVSERSEMARGLSGRKRMPREQGVLFVVRERHGFWMRGMQIPLDIIFFDGQGRILEVLPDQPPCYLCQPVKIREETAYALEVNAGLVTKYQIRTGDRFVAGTAAEEMERRAESKKAEGEERKAESDDAAAAEPAAESKKAEIAEPGARSENAESTDGRAQEAGAEKTTAEGQKPEASKEIMSKE